jgi:hypothetical protein
MPFTNTEKLAAVQRELGFRRRVYAKRVAEGQMSKALADEQIAVFEQIESDYQKLTESDRLL